MINNEAKEKSSKTTITRVMDSQDNLYLSINNLRSIVSDLEKPELKGVSEGKEEVGKVTKPTFEEVWKNVPGFLDDTSNEIIALTSRIVKLIK